MRKLTHAVYTFETITGAVVHLVGDVLTHRHAQVEANQDTQRAWLIVADQATDSVARMVVRERAARCERRLVQLDRFLRHASK